MMEKAARYSAIQHVQLTQRLASHALYSPTSGNQNKATGAQALRNNTRAKTQLLDSQAFVDNTTGFDNTVTDWWALFRDRNGRQKHRSLRLTAFCDD
jgi:hypothetical protein